MLVIVRLPTGSSVQIMLVFVLLLLVMCFILLVFVLLVRPVGTRPPSDRLGCQLSYSHRIRLGGMSNIVVCVWWPCDMFMVVTVSNHSST